MEHLTLLEVHVAKMNDFLQDDDFYLTPLREVLSLKVPFASLHECATGYEKAGVYIRKKSTSLEEKDDLASCYALAITQFLIKKKGFEWKLRMGCWTKVYYEPVLLTKRNKYSSPVGSATSCLAKRGKTAFELFYWFITGIPYDELSRELLAEQSS